MSDWYVYLIRCDNDSLYCGITTDMKRRFQEHKDGNGAKYFYSRKPLKVVFEKKVATRSDATKLEIKIKRLNKKQKEELVLGHDLSILS